MQHFYLIFVRTLDINKDLVESNLVWEFQVLGRSVYALFTVKTVLFYARISFDFFLENGDR